MPYWISCDFRDYKDLTSDSTEISIVGNVIVSMMEPGSNHQFDDYATNSVLDMRKYSLRLVSTNILVKLASLLVATTAFKLSCIRFIV